MENKKLKKLGKYFTKGLQAGVLATAILAGTACQQPNGGNEHDDNYYEEPTNPVNPGIDPTEPTNPTNPTNPDKYPAYYINEDFGGQKFVADGEDWTNDSNGEQKFNERNTYAQKFMNEKVAELKQAMTEQLSTPLGDKINTALNQYNGNDINGNYQALAPVFASIEDPFVTTNNVLQYNRFKASYHKLAANAYNNSLGDYKNSPSLQGNKEMSQYTGNIFIQELADANLSYEQLTVDKAKEIMDETLAMVGDQDCTGSAVLKKVVELALYNESLYGLYNFAGNITRVIDSSLPYRSFNNFDDQIYDARHNVSTQNIDDRTM